MRFNTSTFQIVEIRDEWYIANDGDRVRFNIIDHYYHLWTIQDAKDGDVLSSENPFIFRGFGDKRNPNSPTAYCGIDLSGTFILSTENDRWTNRDVHPATKEQRDLLFQKMEEAGYEWNAEKKELKKIEQKPTDKKYTFKAIPHLLSMIQPTDKARALWRKEIEQAYISGGDTGVELVRDIRYKENFEVKKADLEKEFSQ